MGFRSADPVGLQRERETGTSRCETVPERITRRRGKGSGKWSVTVSLVTQSVDCPPGQKSGAEDLTRGLYREGLLWRHVKTVGP